jgi:hypothetical protein
MVVVPVAVVQAAFEWKAKPAEGAAVRVTVVSAPRFVGLANASRAWTVTAAEHPPAVTVRGAVVKARTLGAPGLMVSVWVAEESPPDDPVMVGVPAAVPLK